MSAGNKKKRMYFYGCRETLIKQLLHFSSELDFSNFCYIYTVGMANAYFDKNMLLLKNPQYLPDHYETLTQ